MVAQWLEHRCSTTHMMGAVWVWKSRSKINPWLQHCLSIEWLQHCLSIEKIRVAIGQNSIPWLPFAYFGMGDKKCGKCRQIPSARIATVRRQRNHRFNHGVGIQGNCKGAQGQGADQDVPTQQGGKGLELWVASARNMASSMAPTSSFRRSSCTRPRRAPGSPLVENCLYITAPCAFKGVGVLQRE